ncbi:glycosyltransferase family 2 protein [Krasilnikovia sp. M28-CT-15]|uniref:glycosyltransferase family 2 protein n=1 Tax=Krasilnikovia sp. M28-CT-15 TaxID=3373540 RepID=UPI0038763BED
MKNPKVSIVIPYRQRLRNIRIAFEAFARQTLPRAEFEIVLGVMEHAPDFTALCQEFSDRLDIVAVSCSYDWQVGRARNLALRMARGSVVVLLDADMAVPRRFLENLWERHFAGGQEHCVVGQMIDYDNNTADVTSAEARPYAFYADRLAELDRHGPGPADARLRTAHVIAWAFAWTALIALPRDTITRHDLFFDLNFHGYGVEDLEWAYRVSRAGVPIVMREDVFGIHLPHQRNVAANRRTEEANYRYFLGKWPSVEVELAAAFGDFEANQQLVAFRRELSEVLPSGSAGPAVVRGASAGVDTVVVGAGLGADGEVCLPVGTTFDAEPEVTVLPLAGLALPFPTGSVQRCVISPSVRGFSTRYRKHILAEAGRVARETTDAAALT